VDTLVLDNELAWQDILPVQWRPLPCAPDRFELLALDESNLLLLQACMAVEEHPLGDGGEDLGPLAGEIARLEFKLDLVLQLLSKLLKTEPMPSATRIAFNRAGASWTCIGTPPEPHAHGLLRVQLRGSLPQPLELASQVSEVDGAIVRVRFPALSENVAELIQKIAFLRHRRHVADVRKARG
jgi:hypothetical protein